MRGMAFIVLFGLVACAAGDAVTPANASSELRGWQTAAGKAPSKSEFAAVLAACEDRAKMRTRARPSRDALPITACTACSERAAGAITPAIRAVRNPASCWRGTGG